MFKIIHFDARLVLFYFKFLSKCMHVFEILKRTIKNEEFMIKY